MTLAYNVVAYNVVAYNAINNLQPLVKVFWDPSTYAGAQCQLVLHAGSREGQH